MPEPVTEAVLAVYRNEMQEGVKMCRRAGGTSIRGGV